MDFIREVIGPLIKKVWETNVKTVEVDPTRLTESDNLAKNQERLKDLCEQFVSRIVLSEKQIPVYVLAIPH